MRRRYTFEEFLAHFRAMMIVGKYTEARLTYRGDDRRMHLGERRDDLALIARVTDYFSQLSDPPDLVKAARFTCMLGWIVHHFPRLCESGDARVSPDNDGTNEFADWALQAVFETFKAKRWDGSAVEVERVQARAKVLRKAQEDEQQAGA